MECHPYGFCGVRLITDRCIGGTAETSGTVAGTSSPTGRNASRTPGAHLAMYSVTSRATDGKRLVQNAKSANCAMVTPRKIRRVRSTPSALPRVFSTYCAGAPWDVRSSSARTLAHNTCCTMAARYRSEAGSTPAAGSSAPGVDPKAAGSATNDRGMNAKPSPATVRTTCRRYQSAAGRSNGAPGS